MKRETYVASEDSSLLRRVLADYSGATCLEIGAGNGGNLRELARRFAVAVGTDLARPGLEDWREVGASYVLADAASCFTRETFDLVAFNPPYLQAGEISDRAVDGGMEGVEVALRFLKSALNVVKKDGRILFLLTSGNPIEQIEKECLTRGFRLEKKAELRLFYESLSVYEASASGEAVRAKALPDALQP